MNKDSLIYSGPPILGVLFLIVFFSIVAFGGPLWSWLAIPIGLAFIPLIIKSSRLSEAIVENDLKLNPTESCLTCGQSLCRDCGTHYKERS